MKTNIFLQRFFTRCPRIIGSVMMGVLMIPAIAFTQTVYDNPSVVPLGTAGNFRILAGSTVTIISGTTITGDVGVSPGTVVTNGGTVNGTIHLNTAGAIQAQIDLTTAYDNAAGRSANATVPTELGGTTLGRGVYTSAAGTFGITGTLLLSGTANDVFIFKMASTLTTGASSNVNLTGGALATNVFWQVGSSATIDGNFKGIILALTAITQNTGASSIDGRLLARNSFVTSGGTSVLPVELTSFSAASNNNAIELNWNTSTEVNNYGFEIERSRLNNNFEKIGFVKGSGNSNSAKNYFFTDKQTLSGKYFYRLKQIDNDGAFEYSKVVEADFKLLQSFELSQNYPNPFNPTTSISYSIPLDSRVELLIYGITGEVVKSLVNEYQTAGIYSVNFNAAGLSSGIYFYKIIANNFLQVKKMSVIK